MLHPVASGGMAEVYAVEDPISGERFALKLLVEVKVALERFNIEYEAMTRLNHPGIVRVYHYGLHQGHPWLTMQLLTGIPAQSWVKQLGSPGTPERTQEVLRIAYHLAQALGYVHDRGLVHRDLKSANVLVLPDGRVKLIDFGTAHLRDALKGVTKDGEFVGTYAYASPEQVSCTQIDYRSDLYSFGVLLYRLVTGRRPFSSSDTTALIHAHLAITPADPRTLIPSLDEGLCALILQLLEKEPSKRPANASVVAQRLEDIAGTPFSARTPLVLHQSYCTERDQERSEIREHLAENPAAAVLVIGDAGSDRIRVVDRMMGEAHERGVQVFHASLRSGEDVKALLGMLKVIGRQGDKGKRAVRALRKISRANATQLAVGKVRTTLRKSVHGTFASLDQSEILVGIHGLEHATALTLEVLAGMRTAETPVSFIAGCSADAIENKQEIRRRFSDALEVKLPPLSPSQLAFAVGTMVGRRPPPAQLAHVLHTVTDGQPLYIEEAVRNLLATGALMADDGNRVDWADSHLSIDVPSAAAKDAAQVLSLLAHYHRRALQVVALVDDDLELNLIASALEWEPEQTRVVLQDLVDHRLLSWSRPDTVVWQQRRLQGFLRDSMPACRRRVHEKRLADQMRGYAPTATQVRLLLATGALEEAAERCVHAAHDAMSEGKYRLALDVLEPVISRASSTDLAGEIHLLHASCLQVLRPLDRAAARSLAIAKKQLSSNPSYQAELALASARMAAGIGHYRNHVSFMHVAWESASKAALPTVQLETCLALALAESQRGNLTEGKTWLDKAQKTAIVSPDRSALGRVTLARADYALTTGDINAAESLSGKAMQFFQRMKDQTGYWSAIAVWSETLRHQGRYSEALAVLSLRAPEARGADDPSPYIHMLLTTAWIEVDLCRLGRAQEIVDDISSILHQGERLNLRLNVQLLNGRIALASGKFNTAEFLLQQTHERARSADLSVIAEHGRALLAEVSWHRRQRTRSNELFQSALLGLMGLGNRVVLARACMSRARVWARENDPVTLFKPVHSLLDEPSFAVLQLEYQLACGRHQRQAGDRDQMLTHYRTAARLLNRIADNLNDTDRAALRVHPWSSRIRRGLG